MGLPIQCIREIFDGELTSPKKGYMMKAHSITTTPKEQG